MNRKLMTALFSLSMIMTAVPVQVKAEENNIPEEPEVVEQSAESESEVQAESMVNEEPVSEGHVTDIVDPVCLCEKACTDESHDPDCPVCSQKGSSLEQCSKYIAVENTISPQKEIEEMDVPAENSRQTSESVEEPKTETEEFMKAEETPESVTPESVQKTEPAEQIFESEKVELERENKTGEDPVVPAIQNSVLSFSPKMIQRAPAAVKELSQETIKPYQSSVGRDKSYYLTNGTYRLVENITLEGALGIAVANIVELDLNGHTLSATNSDGKVVCIFRDASLTIKATGGGSIVGNGSSKAPIYNEGTFCFKGGTIDEIILWPGSTFYADGGIVNGDVTANTGVRPSPKIQRNNDALDYTTFNGTIARDVSIDESAKLTVTFKNGDEIIDTERVLKGKTVSKPVNDPVKEGYYFMGWYQANLPYDFSKAVTDNIDLTAKWPYKISFDTNGAGEVSPYYKKNGEQIGELPMPGRDGYVFDGWYTSAGFKVKESDKINVETTYYAHWKCDVSNLNIVINDQTYTGSEIIPEITVKQGDTLLKRDSDYTLYFFDNKNAGTASVTVTGKAPANRKDPISYTGSVTKKFNILPKPVTVSGITASDKSYDGNKNAILDTSKAVINGVVGNDELRVTASGTFDNANAGDQKKVNIDAFLTGTSSGNYKLSPESQKETFASIKKINPELSVEAVSIKKYSDNDFQLNVTHKGNGVVSYSSGNTSIISVNNEGLVHIVNAGTAAITVSLAESENYKAASDVISVTVNQADGKISITDVVINKQYGDEDFSVKPFNNTPGEIKYTADNSGTVTVDADGKVHINKAGTGYITISMDATQNHKAVSETIKVNVEPKPVSIQWNNADSFKYDGNQHSISASIKGLMENDTADLTYSNNQAIDAGTYIVSITAISNSNYKLSTGNLSHVWTITKRNITLTSSDAHKMYDGAALTSNKVTVNGDDFVTGQGATYEFTGSQTGPGESGNTFTYTLKDGTSADNYSITVVYGKLIVAEAYLITYSDGVENKEIFADQIYKDEKGKKTPEFQGTPDREGYQFIGWNPAFSNTVTENVTYTAQWKDITAPVITGVQDRGIYCSPQTITITDNSDVTVIVNDKEIELTENQFKFVPEGTQVITAVDTAGNKTEVTMHYGHTDLEHVKALAATVKKDGNIECWFCRNCHKYFSDPNGTKEISLSDTVITRLSPEILDGHSQSVTVGDRTALTFRSNTEMEDFVRVEINRIEIDKKNYTVWKGSTNVKLHEDYISSLPAGTYTISIVSRNDLFPEDEVTLISAKTTFTVKENPAPAVTVPENQSPAGNTVIPQSELPPNGLPSHEVSMNKKPLNEIPRNEVSLNKKSLNEVPPVGASLNETQKVTESASVIFPQDKAVYTKIPDTADGGISRWFVTMVSAIVMALGAAYIMRKR